MSQFWSDNPGGAEIGEGIGGYLLMVSGDWLDALLCYPAAQLSVDLIADFPEFSQHRFGRAVEGGRVFKAPVEADTRSWKVRTVFLRLIAYGDHVSEAGFPQELTQMLRSVPSEVDPYLTHDLDSIRVNPFRLETSAERIVMISSVFA